MRASCWARMPRAARARPVALPCGEATTSALVPEGVEAVLLEVLGGALGQGVPLGPSLVAPVPGTGVAQDQGRDPIGKTQMERQRQVAAEG